MHDLFYHSGMDNMSCNCRFKLRIDFTKQFFWWIVFSHLRNFKHSYHSYLLLRNLKGKFHNLNYTEEHNHLVCSAHQFCGRFKLILNYAVGGVNYYQMLDTPVQESAKTMLKECLLPAQWIPSSYYTKLPFTFGKAFSPFMNWKIWYKRLASKISHLSPTGHFCESIPEKASVSDFCA